MRELDELFVRWEERHRQAGWKRFVRDGIVDETWWGRPQSVPKVCFFLKEARTEREAGYDLARALYEYEPWKLWQRAAIWTQAVQRGLTEARPYDDAELRRNAHRAIRQTARALPGPARRICGSILRRTEICCGRSWSGSARMSLCADIHLKCCGTCWAQSWNVGIPRIVCMAFGEKHWSSTIIIRPAVTQTGSTTTRCFPSASWQKASGKSAGRSERENRSTHCRNSCFIFCHIL